MNNRPAAGFAAAALAVPVVLLCCLGPAGAASLLAGSIARLGGLDGIAVASVTVAVGLVAYALLSRENAGLRRGGRS